jgi:hypothetical protein
VCWLLSCGEERRRDGVKKWRKKRKKDCCKHKLLRLRPAW